MMFTEAKPSLIRYLPLTNRFTIILPMKSISLYRKYYMKTIYFLFKLSYTIYILEVTTFRSEHKELVRFKIDFGRVGHILK